MNARTRILTSVASVGLLAASILAAAPAWAETDNSLAAPVGTTDFCFAHMAEQQGSETQALYCQLQQGPGRDGGYTGTVDGVMGPNSWRGVQTWLASHGYSPGAIDGTPGTNTYAALQRWASDPVYAGYSGPIDGIMGPNSWAGVGKAVKLGFFSD